jgi:hypothetical protein
MWRVINTARTVGTYDDNVQFPYSTSRHHPDALLLDSGGGPEPLGRDSPRAICIFA